MEREMYKAMETIDMLSLAAALYKANKKLIDKLAIVLAKCDRAEVKQLKKELNMMENCYFDERDFFELEEEYGTRKLLLFELEVKPFMVATIACIIIKVYADRRGIDVSFDTAVIYAREMFNLALDDEKHKTFYQYLQEAVLTVNSYLQEEQVG